MDDVLDPRKDAGALEGEAAGPLPTTITTPSITPPEPQAMNPALPGSPVDFPEGVGLQNVRKREEDAQRTHKQVWTDVLDQSIVNSVLEVAEDLPAAVRTLFDTGVAELEPHREELTKDIPMHLRDEVMRSLTVVGARARRDRILEDRRVQGRIAQQTGLSRTALGFAASLLDADLPLIFATGGTVAAGKTAGAVARTVRSVGGSTRLAQTAGDAAVGVTGGALAGGIVGGAGVASRDDYDAATLFQYIVAGSALGGVLNPAIGRVLPDTQVWKQAADIEVSRSRAAAERDIFRQLADPASDIHNNRSVVADTDHADNRGVLIHLDDTPADGAPADRSVGAAEVRPAEKDIEEDTLGLAATGAPQGVVETSLRSQKWKQDSAFAERYEADTASPAVKLLVGGSDFKVRLPFTNREVPVGQALGFALTLAQRDFTTLVHSNAPSANFVAAEILESASGLGRNGATAAVFREMFHSSAMVHSATAIRDFRGQYMRTRGLNPLNASSSRKFSADIRLQMQNRRFGKDIDPEYKDVLDGIERTNHEALGHMRGPDEARSVRGAREITAENGPPTPGYFRHAWEPKHFLPFIRTSEGRRSLVQAFKIGLMRGSDLDSALADEIATAYVRRFSDKATGTAGADSRLLDLDSRAGVEEVLEASNLSRKEIDRIMKRLEVNTQERTKKGYLKQRLEMDLTVEIPGSDQRLVDLMSDDFERTLHQYVGDAAGAAALAHKGVRDSADINNLIEATMREQAALGEAGITRPHLEAIFSQFQGSAHKGFIRGTQTTSVSPLTSVLTKATRASLLQRTGLTQVMDTANLFVANGVARTMEPIMTKLGWNKPGHLTKAEMQNLRGELESLAVIVGKDHDIFAPHMSIDETELADNFAFNFVQRAMGTVERATHFMSGQVHVTSYQQQIAVAATSTNVIRTLAGHKTNLTTRKLRDLGLEGDVIHELEDLINTGVIKVDGGKVELNTAQWDAETRLAFGAAMVRGTHQQVQKNMIGETSVWMNTDIGKLLSSLKTFSLVATQKQMARNLMIGGSSHFVSASAWQIGFAFGVLTLAQGIQGTEMDPADRAWLAAAYTPNIGAVPMLLDPMTSMMGFDDLNFSPYGRYASYLDTPVFETVEKLARAPGAIGKMLSGEGTYTDQQNARAMFLMNWYGMKRVWEAM